MENRLELFNKTYDTLVTAWSIGELEYGDCSKCVVGNICYGSEWWSFRFFTTNGTQIRDSRYDRFEDSSPYDLKRADLVIGRSGYSLDDLAKLEFAFEAAIPKFSFEKNTPDEQYIGLCAVMEVLWEIHGIQDRSLTTLNAVASDKGVTVNA